MVFSIVATQFILLPTVYEDSLFSISFQTLIIGWLFDDSLLACFSKYELREMARQTQDPRFSSFIDKLVLHVNYQNHMYILNSVSRTEVHILSTHLGKFVTYCISFQYVLVGSLCVLSWSINILQVWKCSSVLVIIVILFLIMVTDVEHLIFAIHCARPFTHNLILSTLLCKVRIIIIIFKESEAQRN